MLRASSEARKTAAQPISSGVCSRFMGTMALHACLEDLAGRHPGVLAAPLAMRSAVPCQKAVQRCRGRWRSR